MIISRVQAFLLSYPLAEPLRLPFWGGERTIIKRDAMLIRIESDNGLIGYAPGLASVYAQSIMQDTVGPFWEGRRLADPDALRIQFLAGPGQHPDVAKVYSAAEVALYDLCAKAKGVPLSEELGGRVRDRIQLYGSAGMYLSPEGFAAEAAAIARQGFRAYKMRPALGPEQDLLAVRRMREAVGPDFELMVDAHTWWRMGDRSYDFDTVEQLARDFAGHNTTWLEEPLPPDDHDAYARLKEKDHLPLASGEHEPSEENYLDLIQQQAVDYVQMDLGCQGGVSTARRLLVEIERAGLRFAFHSWGTALEVITAAHLGVCWPESVVEWLEYPCYATSQRAGMYPFPLAAEILREPLAIERGELVVPRAPGLGVMVDEAVIDRYPWIPGPWSYFRTDSPAEIRAVTADHSVKWERYSAG